jgi:hypothetical protein
MLNYDMTQCHLQAYFAANAAAQASRRSSPRVTNEEVQKDVSTYGLNSLHAYSMLIYTNHFLYIHTGCCSEGL